MLNQVRHDVKGFVMRSTGRIIVLAVVAAVLAGAVAGAAEAAPRLSPAQKDRLKALAGETRDRTERAREELRRARMELGTVFGAYNLDDKKARSAQERVSKAQLDLLRTHLDNQVEIRHVLSRYQFEQFNQILSRKTHGGPMGEFHHFDEAGPGFLLDGRLLSELDLSADQSKRLRSLLKEPERRKLFEKIANDSRQMIALYQRYDLDVSAARRLIESIHSTQQDLAALHLRSQQALRSVLTPSQFERYQNALAEKMRSRMQGKPRPPFHRPR